MKVQLPWIGKAAGSSAGAIYQTYWGNTYSRSFPALFHYPDTKKQQECQASFFDIQRIWLPIYNTISTQIGKMQRKNKNPFNQLTSSIYHIFNPYKEQKLSRLPNFFGLDPKNRVRIFFSIDEMRIDATAVEMWFTWFRPYIEIDMTPTTLHFLLFNLSRTSMYYQTIPFSTDYRNIDFRNTNEWKEGDKLTLYVAISGDSWFGNFNIQKL